MGLHSCYGPSNPPQAPRDEPLPKSRKPEPSAGTHRQLPRPDADYADYADSLRRHQRLVFHPVWSLFFFVNDLGRL